MSYSRPWCLAIVVIAPLSMSWNAHADTPQSWPTVHSVASEHPDQIVMLSPYASADVFNRFEVPTHHFDDGQRVWLWCDGKSVPKTLHKESSLDWTVLKVAPEPTCPGASVISNHPIPRQIWNSAAATENEVQRVRDKLDSNKATVTAKITVRGDAFYLVADPTFGDVYGEPGTRLLAADLEPISSLEVAHARPFVDLDGDGFPELTVPGSDSPAVFVVQLFPTGRHLDRIMPATVLTHLLFPEPYPEAFIAELRLAKEWLAVFPEEIKATTLTVVAAEGQDRVRVSVDGETQPLYIVRRLVAKPGPITTAFTGEAVLQLGESLSVSERCSLEGRPKDTDVSLELVCDDKQQVLAVYPTGTSAPQESTAVLWAGDLDRDRLPDVLLRERNGYGGTPVRGLYLSTRASGGLVGDAARD